MNQTKQAAIKAFFDDFVVAFAKFDSDHVASKFSFPYLAKGPGDASRTFNTKPELSDYFQEVLNDYKRQGCRDCQYSPPEITWFGAECAAASVTWTLTDTSGSPVTCWTESYILAVANGKALAFVTVDHVDE